MPKVMLINVANREENRIAILSDGLLEEVSIETARYERIEGNIYKARVVKVIASLDAVFVDYGASRNGFLPIQDIHPKYLSGSKRTVEALKKGQDLMVQVRKGELGQKGAALTTYISLPGRYFVLMPFIDKRGVSRKIGDDKTRKQLRQVLDSTGIPEEMGYIARTAAEGRTKQELTRDAGYLLRLWRRIEKEFEAARGPAPLYQESGIVIRTIRDYFSPSIVEVWVDDGDVYEQVKSFFQTVMPWYTKRLKRFEKKSPLFSKYNLEEQIATIYDKTVRLPSGGSIVIEQTEALVSIDVNSGAGKKGKDIEETALITNREAAGEVARQLRLRDLGGLIVIDFIDMRAASKRTEVKKELQQALKEDKARTDVGSISKFGMLELSRQRLKPAATKGVTTPCDRCGGTGQIRSPESFTLGVLRLVQAEMARGRVTETRIGVASDIATLLLNRKRDKIREFEADFGAEISVFPEPTLAPNQYYIEYRNGGELRTDTNLGREAPKGSLRTPLGLPDAPAETVRLNIYTLDDDGDEGEVPDVPIEPPEEGGGDMITDVDTTSSPREEEGTPSKKRRRRRRRRKKKTEGEAPTADTPEGEPLSEGSVAVERLEDTPEEQETPVTDDGEAVPEGEEAPKKKRRRRRRRRRKRPEEGESASAEVDDTGVEGAPAAESGGETTPEGDSGARPKPPSTDGESTEPETEKTPARRRTRRRKKVETPPEPPAEPAETPEVASKPEPVRESEASAPASENPRPRRRTPRAKAVEPPAETAPQDGRTALDEGPPPVKPARKRARKTASKKTAETETGATEGPAAGDPAPEKSKRHAPRTKTKAKATTADEGSEEKPASAKRPRKRAVKKPPPDDTAPGPNIEATQATKPRRRRAPTKAASSSEAENARPAEGTATGEPPKKPLRSRARKAAAPPEET